MRSWFSIACSRPIRLSAIVQNKRRHGERARGRKQPFVAKDLNPAVAGRVGGVLGVAIQHQTAFDQV
jgi:hypothetical protein